MSWTWDLAKNAENLTKHRVPFEIAQRVFDDDYCFTYDDPFPDEQRFRTIGVVGPAMLIVIHTEEEPDPQTGERAGRIISARKVTRLERVIYEEE